MLQHVLMPGLFLKKELSSLEVKDSTRQLGSFTKNGKLIYRLIKQAFTDEKRHFEYVGICAPGKYTSLRFF